MRYLSIVGATIAAGLLAGCQGANVRANEPKMLSGDIDSVTRCTFQALTDAGFGPPGLTLLQFADQTNKSRILYSAVSGGEFEVGAALLRIDFEQLGPNQVQATLHPTTYFGAAVSEAAIPALESCQGG